MIIDHNRPNDPPPANGTDKTDGADEQSSNERTLILDATCAPQNNAYPQDVNLLNEAGENLEDMIDHLCLKFSYYTPRMYRRNARRDYLNLAKCKKRTAKKIRKAIRQQL